MVEKYVYMILDPEKMDLDYLEFFDTYREGEALFKSNSEFGLDGLMLKPKKEHFLFGIILRDVMK